MFALLENIFGYYDNILGKSLIFIFCFISFIYYKSKGSKYSILLFFYFTLWFMLLFGSTGCGGIGCFGNGDIIIMLTIFVVCIFIIFILFDVFLSLLGFIDKSKKYNVKDKIKDIDIGNIKNIELKYNNGPKYNVNYKELKKIIIYIINNTGKTKYKALELQNFYNFILKTYKLEGKKYKKNLSKLKEFVDNGGEIVVEYKKIG